MLDAVSSTGSLSVLLSAMGTTRTTQTVLALIRNHSHMCAHAMFTSRGSVYLVEELRIVQLLFEGDLYSKKYGRWHATID